MVRIIFSVFAFFLLPVLRGAEPEFYVWQRKHGPEVEQAVTGFYRTAPGKLYFLAGELENDGRVIRIPPPKAAELRRAVPVVRIHVKNLRKAPGLLAAEIAGASSPWRGTKALQVDLDAPESKLAYYRAVMEELRKLLPGTELSATVLPCHLKHEAAFRELARACDFYVLQVHGLARRNGAWSIWDAPAAFRAVERAKALRLPFKTALPLYGSAVGGRLVRPDPAQVGQLAGICGDVIVFRLGIPGDGSALDLETARRVCRGGGYTPKVEPRWERQAGGAWHLFLRNRGFFAEKTVLALDFGTKAADIDTFNHAVWDGTKGELTLVLPPPGMEKPYLWLRSEKNGEPSLTVRMRGEK